MDDGLPVDRPRAALRATVKVPDIRLWQAAPATGHALPGEGLLPVLPKIGIFPSHLFATMLLPYFHHTAPPFCPF